MAIGYAELEVLADCCVPGRTVGVLSRLRSYASAASRRLVLGLQSAAANFPDHAV